MLCQFTFENFKSFRDEVTLDFQATKSHEFEESLLSSGGLPNKMLPLAGIYGPNGGGKSGVLEALQCVIGNILRPIKAMEDFSIHERVTIPNARLVPFKFDTLSRQKPTNFELFFRTNKAEYRYFISFARNNKLDIALPAIAQERLDKKSFETGRVSLLFERADANVHLGKSLKLKPGAATINNTLPFLSFLYINYEIEEVIDVINWLDSCTVFRDSRKYSFQKNTATKIAEAADSNEDLRQLIKHMDIGISDYSIRTRKIETPEGEERLRHSITLMHTIEDERFELSENEESQGTQRVLNLLPDLLISLQKGTLIIADELDSQLHPKLLEQILLLYRNPNINKGGGQLLFTSHDISTMKSSVLRRDEIWFAAKDETESSILYSLSEIKDEKGAVIRPDAVYGKQYLNGRYGADPYFERIKNWSSDVE